MSHSYEKHTWSVGEVITKALIDRMETGIDNAVDKSGDTITYKLDFVKNSSPQQKGTVLWDETSGYGRMKIQQYAQVTTLDPNGFYKNDDPNHTIADTYSFPKKEANDFTSTNYRIFTSNGAVNGAAYWDSGTATDNDLQYGTLPARYGGTGFDEASLLENPGKVLKVATASGRWQLMDDKNTTYTFTKTGASLLITPSEGNPTTIAWGNAANRSFTETISTENGDKLPTSTAVINYINSLPTTVKDYTSANGRTSATGTATKVDISGRAVWNDNLTTRVGSVIELYTQDVNVSSTPFISNTSPYNNALGINNGYFYFRERTASIAEPETYRLPAPTVSSGSYDILTSKHYLPAEYGRLAALKLNDTTNDFVRNCAVFGAFGAFDSRVIDQLSGNANIVMPSLPSNQSVQSQGVWVTGIFKTQYCYITGNPPMFNIDSQDSTKSTISWGSLPALNLRYTKITNLENLVTRSSNTITGINVSTALPQYEDITLASFRARHVTAGSNWKQRWPMGTERQAVIDVVTYADDEFNDPDPDEEDYGNNKHGNFAFHLPTCTWQEWVTAYNDSQDSTKAESFGVHYSILTTKNYFLGSQVLSVKFPENTATTIGTSGITIGYDETNQKAGKQDTNNNEYTSRIPWPIKFTSADYAMTITLEYASGIPFSNLAIVPRNITASGFQFSIYSSSSFTIAARTTLKFHCLAIKTIPETWSSDDNA